MADSREDETFYGKSGWRSQPMLRSLSEVHRTLVVPHPASFYRKLLAFAGPGFLVAVGYMDPGNWATDLAGGSKFNYTLLSVIMISNFMAILLQSLPQTGDRDRARPRPSLPRPLQQARLLLPLDHMRTGHRGVRPRRSDRLGDRI